MAAASDFLEDSILDHVLRNTAYTSPTTVYVSLHTGSPGDDDLGANEITTSGSAYARASASFAAASGGSISTNAAINYSAATSNWGTVSHIGIYDQSTGGNLLFHGALTTSKTIETGDTLSIASGSLTVTLA